MRQERRGGSGRVAQAWHGRRGGPRPARQSGGSDIDRRHDGKSARARRRQSGDRRGHLGRQRDLRRLGDRPWRDLHPLCGGPRDCLPHALCGPVPGRGSARRRDRHARAGRRFGRHHRGGSCRQRVRCPSTAPACIAASSEGTAGSSRRSTTSRSSISRVLRSEAAVSRTRH